VKLGALEKYSKNNFTKYILVFFGLNLASHLPVCILVEWVPKSIHAVARDGDFKRAVNCKVLLA